MVIGLFLYFEGGKKDSWKQGAPLPYERREQKNPNILMELN